MGQHAAVSRSKSLLLDPSLVTIALDESVPLPVSWSAVL